jgi:hypothetical protein
VSAARIVKAVYVFEIAISALRLVSQGCRQISSALMVLKNVSTAALS